MKKSILVLALIAFNLSAFAKISITSDLPDRSIELTSLEVQTQRNMGGFKTYKDGETKLFESVILQSVKDADHKQRIQLTIRVPGECSLYGCAHDMSKKTFSYIYYDHGGFPGKAQKISGKDAEDLSKAFEATRDGTKILLTVDKNGKIKNLHLEENQDLTKSVVSSDRGNNKSDLRKSNVSEAQRSPGARQE
jgi:hypothetical protein